MNFLVISCCIVAAVAEISIVNSSRVLPRQDDFSPRPSIGSNPQSPFSGIAPSTTCAKKDLVILMTYLIKIFPTEFEHTPCLNPSRSEAIPNGILEGVHRNNKGHLNELEFTRSVMSAMTKVKVAQCESLLPAFDDKKNDKRISLEEWMDCFVNAANVWHKEYCPLQRKDMLKRSQANIDGGNFYVPECTPGGRWKVVQCGRSDCWCVDEETGNELPNTRVKGGKPNCSNVNTPRGPPRQDVKPAGPAQIPPVGTNPQSWSTPNIRITMSIKMRLVTLMRSLIENVTVEFKHIQCPNSRRPEGIPKCMFQGLDRNNDGYLDELEFNGSVISAMTQGSFDQSDGLLPAFCDKNNDKRISLEEWIDRFVNTVSVWDKQYCPLQRNQMLRQSQANMGGRHFYIPDCTPEGRWQVVQCSHNDCWCVDEETGNELPNTRLKGGVPNCSNVKPLSGSSGQDDFVNTKIKAVAPAQPPSIYRNPQNSSPNYTLPTAHIEKNLVVLIAYLKEVFMAEFRYKPCPNSHTFEGIAHCKFANLDTNNDGYLDELEFNITVVSAMTVVTVNQYESSLFARCDGNNDKRISLEEWSDCFVKTYNMWKRNSCPTTRYSLLTDPQAKGKFHVPECTPEGRWKALQCDRRDCWCVDEATGNELPKTRLEGGVPNCSNVTSFVIIAGPEEVVYFTDKSVAPTQFPPRDSNNESLFPNNTASSRSIRRDLVILITYLTDVFPQKFQQTPCSNSSREAVSSCMFRDFDRNNDAYLDEVEFNESVISSMTKETFGPAEKLLPAFCDENNDKRISSREWSECFVNTVDMWRKEYCPLQRISMLKCAQAVRDKNKFYIPECTSQGLWRAVQCSNGGCWCVDEETGNSLPNTYVKAGMPKCSNLPKVKLIEGCGVRGRIALMNKINHKYHIKKNTNKRPTKKATAGAVKLFDRLDIDKDGFLHTEQEWHSIRTMVKSNCIKKLPQFCDLNADRTISKTEWVECLMSEVPSIYLEKSVTSAPLPNSF